MGAIQREGLVLMYVRCLLTAAIAASSLVAVSARADEQCDSYYEVKRGDTLSKISRRFYGEFDAERIHRANRAIIGSDGELIEVGMRLWVPCRGDPPPITAASVTVDRKVDAGAEAPLAKGPLAGGPPLRVLAGPARAPLIGPDLPDGGMLEEMLAAAGGMAGFSINPPASAPVAGAQLAGLLAAGAFDIGFPWTKPDCEGADPKAAACAGLIFSDPFYEVEMGLFVQKGGRYANAAGLADLAGARICRPVTLGMEDLEAAGLPADAETIRLDTEAACLDQLGRGMVDVVSIDADAAGALLDGTAADGIARLPFGTSQLLYAAAPGGNPRSRLVLDEINRGLAALRGSGRWFEIAHRHLAKAQEVAGKDQPKG